MKLEKGILDLLVQMEEELGLAVKLQEEKVGLLAVKLEEEKGRLFQRLMEVVQEDRRGRGVDLEMFNL